MDIASVFRKAPIDKLQGTYQGKLLHRVQEVFSTEEQGLFIASFYCYLNNHATKDFVVDLDGVWQWLGYSRKDNAKRKLEQSFSKDFDYRSVRIEAGQRRHGRGGHNREDIMMNIETFKSMCQLSDTDKGRTVRKYYIRLETLMHELLEEQTSELARQLRAETTRAEEQAIRADQLQKRLDKSGRRYTAGVLGEVVYIFGDDAGHLHKIGSTGDIQQREAEAATFNIVAKMQREVPCVNAYLTEKAAQHILDKRRVNKRYEWFAVNLEEATTVVEAAAQFLDKYLEAPEQMRELRDLINATPCTAEPPPPPPRVRFMVPDDHTKSVVQYTMEGIFVARFDKGAMEVVNKGLFKDEKAVYQKIRRAASDAPKRQGPDFCVRLPVEGRAPHGGAQLALQGGRAVPPASRRWVLRQLLSLDQGGGRRRGRELLQDAQGLRQRRGAQGVRVDHRPAHPIRDGRGRPGRGEAEEDAQAQA